MNHESFMQGFLSGLEKNAGATMVHGSKGWPKGALHGSILRGRMIRILKWLRLGHASGRLRHILKRSRPRKKLDDPKMLRHENELRDLAKRITSAQTLRNAGLLVALGVGTHTAVNKLLEPPKKKRT